MVASNKKYSNGLNGTKKTDILLTGGYCPFCGAKELIDLGDRFVCESCGASMDRSEIKTQPFETQKPTAKQDVGIKKIAPTGSIEEQIKIIVQTLGQCTEKELKYHSSDLCKLDAPILIFHLQNMIKNHLIGVINKGERHYCSIEISEKSIVDLTEIEAKLSFLEKKSTDLERDIFTSKAALNLSKQKANRARGIVTEAETTLSAIRVKAHEDLIGYESELSALQQERTRINIDKARKALSQTEGIYASRRTSIEQRLEEISRALETLNQEAVAARKNAEKAIFFKKKKLRKVDLLATKISSLQAEFTNLASELSNIQAEQDQKVAELNQIISKQQCEKDRLEAQIYDVAEKKKDAECALDKAEMSYKEKTDELESANKEADEIQKRVSAYEAELKKLEERIEFFKQRRQSILMEQKNQQEENAEAPQDHSDTSDADILSKLPTVLQKLDEAYPDKVVGDFRNDNQHWYRVMMQIVKIQGYDSKESFLKAHGYTLKQAPNTRSDAAKETMLQKKLSNLLKKLDEAYPDKNIYGLASRHGSWATTASELAKELGYVDRDAFLVANGYTLLPYPPVGNQNKCEEGGTTDTASYAGAGRPAHDRMAIIEELKRRYPSGSEFTSVDDLFAANPDLASKKKTLANTAKESFGMPLGKYLKSIGLLVGSASVKKDEIDYAELLDGFVAELKERLSKKSFVPDSVEKLDRSFSDMDFISARNWIKRLYEGKTLDQYLQEQGILSTPIDADEEMLKYIEILKERYKDRSPLPTMLSELISENQDLPIRKLNQYIRNVLGEAKAERYYIKNRIFQGKPTDLQEYTYCSVFIEERGATFYYRSSNKNVSVGDCVVVDFWGYETAGEIKEVTQCLGIDAPWPVESTKTIIRIATNIKRNKAEATTDLQSENNTKEKAMEPKNLNEIFEMEKIEKAPQKAEYLHWGESFSTPLNGERGFFGTVFRGLEKDIQRAKKICDKQWIHGYIEKTDLEGIFQYSVQHGAEKEIREVLKTIPALKMVTFYVWRDSGCAVCYSHSGYPYITKYPNSMSMTLHVPKTDDEPWIYRRRADEKGFSEYVDFGGDMGYTRYVFPEAKDWNAINYITEIDGSLYKLTGYVGAQAELDATISTDVKQLEANINGKSFVLTGFGAKDEKKITDEIVSRGGVVKSSVSNKTDFVIFFSGYGQETSKLSKAKDLNATGKNITILNEKQLTEFLGGVMQMQEVPVDKSVDPEAELAKSGFVVKNSLLKKYKGKDAEIVIPEIVTSISKNAFANNQTLRKVTFGKNVKKIGESAFEKCPMLEEVVLNEGLTDIGICAFYSCNSLKRIDLPDSVTTIGASAFRATAIESVKIPDRVMELDTWTFAECEQLKEVKMSRSIYRLYEFVFCGCEQLKEIEFPPSLWDIGENTFEDCKSLEKVVFPELAHFSHTIYDDEYYEGSKMLFYGCDKLVIYTTKGSCADEYAKKAGIKVTYL